MPTDSELIFDEDGRDRGSFASEWILSHRPGRIDGEWVVFASRSGCSYEPDASLSLLRDFVQLANGNDRVVQRFAAKYGALGLCEAHGLPAHHRLGRVVARSAADQGMMFGNHLDRGVTTQHERARF